MTRPTLLPIMLGVIVGACASAQDATNSRTDVEINVETSDDHDHNGHSHAVRHLPSGAMLAHLDANKDGKITKAEVEQARAERFAASDQNGDGKLTAAEIVATMEARRAKAERERAERDAARLKRRAEKAKDRAERRVKRMKARFAKQDSDGDGALSVEEFDRRDLEMFARLDVNNDGVIDEGERQATRKKSRRSVRIREMKND